MSSNHDYKCLCEELQCENSLLTLSKARMSKVIKELNELINQGAVKLDLLEEDNRRLKVRIDFYEKP